MKLDLIQQARTDFYNPQIPLNHKMRSKRELFLLKIPIFQLIYQKKGDHNFRNIIEHARLVKTQFGQIIFHNEDDRTFNYVLRGAAIIFVRTKDSDKKEQPRLMKRVGAGEYFGQKMVFGKDEIQSVRTVSSCYLIQLDMPIFYNVFAGHFKYDELRDKINFIKQIWLFKQVKRGLIQRILLSSKTNSYIRNHVLMREGDSAEHLLVILQGQVTLYIHQNGKMKSFCVLSKSQVCGVQQIVQSQHFQYTVVCTADATEILKIQKSYVIDIVNRDIDPQVIHRRKQLTNQLRQRQMNSQKLLTMSHKKQMPQSINNLNETTRQGAFRKRYRSEGGSDSVEPLDRMKILNTLFDRQTQLKCQKIRHFRLNHIRQTNITMHSTKRLLSYTNGPRTFDKDIAMRYLDRRQKQFKRALNKQIEFQSQKILLTPELRVQRSTAVKTHKRKLKNSRKNYFMSLTQI